MGLTYDADSGTETFSDGQGKPWLRVQYQPQGSDLANQWSLEDGVNCSQSFDR